MLRRSTSEKLMERFAKPLWRIFRQADEILWLYHLLLFAALCIVALASLSFHLMLTSVFPDPDGKPASPGRGLYCTAVLLATLWNLGATPIGLIPVSFPPIPLGFATWNAIDDALSDLGKKSARFPRLKRSITNLRSDLSSFGPWSRNAIRVLTFVLFATPFCFVAWNFRREGDHWANLWYAGLVLCLEHAVLLVMATLKQGLTSLWSHGPSDETLEYILEYVKPVTGILHLLCLVFRALNGRAGLLEAIAAFHVIGWSVPGWHVVVYMALLSCRQLWRSLIQMRRWRWQKTGTAVLIVAAALLVFTGLIKQLDFVFDDVADDIVLGVAFGRISVHIAINRLKKSNSAAQDSTPPDARGGATSSSQSSSLQRATSSRAAGRWIATASKIASASKFAAGASQPPSSIRATASTIKNLKPLKYLMLVVVGLGAPLCLGVLFQQRYDVRSSMFKGSVAADSTNLTFHTGVHGDDVHVDIARGVFKLVETEMPPSERKMPNATMPYAICDSRWGKLSALDLAILATLSYFDPERSNDKAFLQDSRKLLFANTASGVPELHLAKGRKDSSTNCSAGGASRAAMRYQVYDFHDIKTRVIAVRGTDPTDPLDIMLDVRLWVEDALLSLFAALLPSIALWPDGLRSSVVEFLARPQRLFQTSRLAKLNFYEDALYEIQVMINGTRSEGWEHVVTGHSLGGGLAGIVGAKLELPSVAFSPPGLKFSRLKHRLRLRQLAHTTVIAPIRDPVPMIDKHTGLVQHTSCSQSSALLCHLPQLMVCDLLQRCGDASNARFRECDFTLGNDGICVARLGKSSCLTLPWLGGAVAAVVVLLTLLGCWWF